MKKLIQQEMETTRRKVARYIRDNVEKGHYPGFLEIKRKFSIGLHTYFKDIAQAYKYAGLTYKRSNFWIKRKTEREENIKRAVIDLIQRENSRGTQITKKK